MSEDKLYRIKTKEGAHINKKVKDDGSRAAIQFDDENGLQGPVDLIEVDESEFIRDREVYVEVEHIERRFGRVIMEDAVVPAVADALTEILIRAVDVGIDVLTNWMSQKVIPAAKVKGGELIDKAKEAHTSNKARKTIKKATSIAVQTNSNVLETIEKAEGETVVHTKEEVEQIINNMRFAALYIAAGIRELSNTVVIDDELDPEKELGIQKNSKN